MELKKSLGQNFFVNRSLAEKIVSQIVTENESRQVLEIGPGQGFFTALFAESDFKVTVVEKDDDLIPYLSKVFPSAIIIHSDFLKVNLSKILQNDGTKTVVYGSLPYNVSKPIIRMCLRNIEMFESLYFIIQKEVAERFVLKQDKKGNSESTSLSIYSKLFADAKILFHIEKGNFVPQPKVTSSFIRFTPNGNQTLVSNHEQFRSFVLSAFKQPRKTLRNNLQNSIYKAQLSSIGETLLQSRPSKLTFEQYVDLWKVINKKDD